MAVLPTFEASSATRGMSFLTGSTRLRLKRQETKMKRAKHQRDDVSDECPCCGEHSITVREVLEAQSHDNVMALWASMRHRPHYTPDGRIAIVDVVEGKEVCVSGEIASMRLGQTLLRVAQTFSKSFG